MAKQIQFTGKMQQAVAHYMRDPTRSKVAAYRSAYDCERMTAHVVSVRAAELFKHTLVAQAVQHINQEALAKVKIDAQWVLERLALIANFNISKFIVIQPCGKATYDFTNADDDDWYCISEYTVETISRDGSEGHYDVAKTKLKPSSRLKAIELIGKLTDVKAFSETIDINALVAVTEMDTDQFKNARREMLSEDDC